jgi:hypothetical protein
MADKTQLEIQIEAEAKELANAQVIPPSQWIGSHKRCHICGQIVPEHDMVSFDQHTGRTRYSCGDCDAG